MKKALLMFFLIVLMSVAPFSIGHSGPMISKSVVPLPPSLQNLPTIPITPWLQVDKQEAFLEGPAFDRQGNLFVSSIFDSRIIKITPNKQVSVILKQDGLLPDGIAIHKDGRLFIACLSGKLAVVNPDGSNFSVIEANYQGFPKSMNDLVFDAQGNLYITDFIGNISGLAGGVYRYSADMKTVHQVVKNLAAANGIGLVPASNVLWVSETCNNALHRIELLKDGITINPIAGAGIPYRFTGGPGGCDSMAIDEAGHIYQALIFQGRLLIFSPNGVPIAQVLIPGRDEGKLLRTTNIAFKPGTDQAYVTASGKGGAWIYTFKGLAKGLTLYSHQ
jgi:lactonase